MPKTASTSWWTYSFEGAIGDFNGVEKDVTYKNVVGNSRDGVTGGWFGFSDKYWLTAVAPTDQSEGAQRRLRELRRRRAVPIQADFLGPEQSVAPGATIENSVLIFAGPKEVTLLAEYATSSSCRISTMRSIGAGSGSSPSRSSMCSTPSSV
ncbi:MAG: membrane protein insertase YidC [Aliidongia sp.]